MYHSDLQKLDNNLIIIDTDISHIHLCSIYAFVRTGALYEEQDERGYAHLLEHLLLKRLTTHRQERLTKFCTSRGMYFNAETGREHTLYYITDIMPEFLPEALEMMHHILFHPVFTESDMEEEKDIVTSELRDRMSSPHHKMQRAFAEYYYGDHVLSREVGGNIDQVEQSSFEKLMKFYKKHYTPETIILSLAGPKTHSPKIQSLIQKTYAKIPAQRAPLITFPPHIPPAKKDFMYLLDFAESVSLEYFFTIPGRKGYSEEERFALYMYEDILGSSRYSRLFLKLREEKRLVYDVSAGTSYSLDTGSFSIDTSCKKEAVTEVAAHISTILHELSTSLVTEEELEEAKTNALVGYYQILDDVNKIASRAGYTYLTRGILLQTQDSLMRYQQVSRDHIMHVARTYIHPEEAYSYATYKEVITIPTLH